MWNELSAEWKTVFEEAWIAFCSGSTPIGAAVFDADGRLVARERNRASEQETVNRRISHAEINAIRCIDTDEIKNLNELVLYASMEPCPMCMGTLVMSRIRNVKYAAQDSYCGLMYLLDVDPYLKSKNIKHEYIGGEAELFQLTVQSYYELIWIERSASDKVLVAFEKKSPMAVQNARRLFENRTLEKWAKEKSVSEVYDSIICM